MAVECLRRLLRVFLGSDAPLGFLCGSSGDTQDENLGKNLRSHLNSELLWITPHPPLISSSPSSPSSPSSYPSPVGILWSSCG